MIVLTLEQGFAIESCDFYGKEEHGGGRNRIFELKIPTDAKPGQEQ